MAGPNLEVFKFGLYLFFPLAIMVHYGDPEWYRKHVAPVRDQFWPREETLWKPPRTQEDLKVAMEEMRAKRLAKLEEKRAGAGVAGTVPSQSSPSVVSAGESVRAQPASLAGRLSAVEEWRRVDRERLV